VPRKKKEKAEILTTLMHRDIFSRVSMEGSARNCWEGKNPLCTKEQLSRWIKDNPALADDIKSAQRMYETARRARTRRLTLDKVEHILKHGLTKTTKIRQTRKRYIVNTDTNQTFLVGFEVIESETSVNDELPISVLSGLDKILNGDRMPVQDAIASLVDEGNLPESTLHEVSEVVEQFQTKLAGVISGKERSKSQEVLRQTIEADCTEL